MGQKVFHSLSQASLADWLSFQKTSAKATSQDNDTILQGSFVGGWRIASNKGGHDKVIPNKSPLTAGQKPSNEAGPFSNSSRPNQHETQRTSSKKHETKDSSAPFCTHALCFDETIFHKLISSNQAYVVFAAKPIKNQPTEKGQQGQNQGHYKPSVALRSLLLSLTHILQADSLKMPLCEFTEHGFTFEIYALVGSSASPSLKMAALVYAFKAEHILKDSVVFKYLLEGKQAKVGQAIKGGLSQFEVDCLSGNGFSDKEKILMSQIGLMNFLSPSGNVNSWTLSPNPQQTLFDLSATLPLPRVANVEQVRSIPFKTPLLKLSLKPAAEVTYAQIAEQQAQGVFRFDVRTTARHDLKMQKFQKECSEIIEGIFVSGEKIARDREILKQHGIRRVINCAGDYCENTFQPEGVSYLTFFLKDSQNENIESLFYRSIDFIEQGLEKGENILVHCVQGISRSVSIVLAYIIYNMGLDYKQAEALVKNKRGIACPNNGFMVELMQFHKRLYEEPPSTLLEPRVFLVSSHCKETPNILTSRLLKQPLFDRRRFVGLDSRGLYIIQTAKVIYVWVGEKCLEPAVTEYWKYANSYIKTLQKNERAPREVVGLSQGKQQAQFLSLWGLGETPPLYECPQYTRLFSQGTPAVPGHLRHLYEKDTEEDDDEDMTGKKRLYIYPDWRIGLGVFDMEDLQGACVVAKERLNDASEDRSSGSANQQSVTLYVWKEPQCLLSADEIDNFVDRIVTAHFAEDFTVSVVEENRPVLSKAFQSCFT